MTDQVLGTPPVLAASAEVQAMIRAGYDVAARHGQEINPVGRALTAVESLWEQGFIVQKASHALRNSALGMSFAGTLGWSLNSLVEANEFTIPRLAIGWAMGAVAATTALKLRRA